MMSISTSEAFLIFAKWRDQKSQLQIGFFRPKLNPRPVGSPGIILSCSEQHNSISAVILIDGQQNEWRVNLADAAFQYGEPADTAVFPEWAERKWQSYLSVELPTGDSVIFAERATQEEN